MRGAPAAAAAYAVPSTSRRACAAHTPGARRRTTVPTLRWPHSPTTVAVAAVRRNDLFSGGAAAAGGGGPQCVYTAMGMALAARLAAHKARLERLVSTGALSVAELEPVVADLRQLTADVPVLAGEWGRMREQLQMLERALAAASAVRQLSTASPAAAPADASSSESESEATTSDDSDADDGASPSARGLPRSSSDLRRRPACVRVQTAALGVVQLDVPDPDALVPPASPRLAGAGELLVCTGRKCSAQGAADTLAGARAAAAGSGVEVSASKCMGKCGRGPCVRARVEGRDGSVLVRGVDAGAAESLLRQHFGAVC